MERCKLEPVARSTAVWVFDGLIATCKHPTLEKRWLSVHNWGRAMDCWVFNERICDFMHMQIEKFDTAIEVLTWRPGGFAELVADELYHRHVYVRLVEPSSYAVASPRIATDHTIGEVYDADPMHRHGYGFKGREIPVQ